MAAFVLVAAAEPIGDGHTDSGMTQETRSVHARLETCDRPDWYVVPAAYVPQIGIAPQLIHDRRRDRWLMHRSHVPMLEAIVGHPIALPQLPAPVTTFDDGRVLRDYQCDGAAFIASRRGTLLADGMRVGKTAQIIAAHEPDSGPLVVVGPLAVRPVWLDWFRSRWPDTEPVVLTGRTYDGAKLDDAKLIFAHYDVIAAWESLGIRRRIGTLAFDEAHALANPKSKRTTAALIMAPNAERVVCATGTPLWNKIAGLHPLLSLCNPGAWGNFRSFTERYASGCPGAYGWTTGEASNVEEFRLRLREVMLRREWKDIQAELPETTRAIETVALTSNETLKLDKIAEEIRDRLEQGVDFHNDRTLIGHLARMRRIVAKRKAPRAAELARDVLDTENRVVIWVWHRSVAETIEKRLDDVPCTLVTGETLEHHREPLLDEWRGSRGGALIISMGVAPAGIDLSAAAHCIFAEIDWTPATMGQAEMRTFSPVRPNFVSFVLADHEIDFRLMEVISNKCEQADKLGVPASDTIGEIISSVFDFGSDTPDDVDLAELANLIASRGEEYPWL